MSGNCRGKNSSRSGESQGIFIVSLEKIDIFEEKSGENGIINKADLIPLKTGRNIWGHVISEIFSLNGEENLLVFIDE